MLLEMYCHVLLVVVLLFTSTSASLCGASRNAKFTVPKLKGRAGSEPASSHEKPVLALKKRQTQAFITDVTTEVEVITIPPTSSEPPVVVTYTITSQSSVSPTIEETPTPSSVLSTSETSTPTYQPSPTITTPPRYGCESGYSLCANEYNGGCCLDGYTCAVDSCIPPATATGEQKTCATGLYLCAASVNYGCCPGGYDCAANECLATGQMSYTSRVTIITTNTIGSTVTSAIPTVIVGSVVAKAAASDLRAKQPTITITPIATASNPAGSDSQISPVVVGGIVAGCVVGILIFIVVGWCTYRRIRSRSNVDPPVGVTTTNFYDPTASVSRTPGSGSSARYHSVTQDHGYFPNQPVQHPVVSSAVLPPPLGVVEMAENSAPYPQQGNAGWWGEGAQPNAGELPGDDRHNQVYEVEGTMPARSQRRWSRPFSGR